MDPDSEMNQTLLFSIMGKILHMVGQSLITQQLHCCRSQQNKHQSVKVMHTYNHVVFIATFINAYVASSHDCNLYVQCVATWAALHYVIVFIIICSYPVALSQCI